MKIQQEVIFKSSAKRMFKALTNSQQFSELTGDPSEINAEIGGKFSCFGGMITEQTIEIEPTKLIV